MSKLLSACTLLLLAPLAGAAPYDAMDYGPFISATFALPNGNVVHRGVFLPFDVPIPGEEAPGKAGLAGVIFDTELLRVAGYWNGGHITWTGVVFDGGHGANPGPAGQLRVATKVGPGWAKDGKLDDPRSLPNGPLPRDWGRYKGLYRSDNDVVFQYTVGETIVLEMPSVEVQGKHRLLCRTLNLAVLEGRATHGRGGCPERKPPDEMSASTRSWKIARTRP